MATIVVGVLVGFTGCASNARLIDSSDPARIRHACIEHGGVRSTAGIGDAVGVTCTDGAYTTVYEFYTDEENHPPQWPVAHK